MIKWTGILAIVLLLCAPAQAAKVYQWVDEQGRTQFTQTPPPAGKEAQRIEPRYVTPGSSDATDTETASPAEPAAATDETSTDEAEIHVMSRTEARAACEGARSRLQTLENTDSLLMTRDADGNLRVLREDEIEQRIKEEKERIQRLCVE